jgi:hypothetical protein
MLLLLRLEVHESDLDVVAARPPALDPEVVRPAHVEDAERTRERRGEALEELEAARAHAVAEGAAGVAVGQLPEGRLRAGHARDLARHSGRWAESAPMTFSR